MLLFHSTPGKNTDSIITLGVNIEFARAMPKKVWLHSWRVRHWTRLHSAARHKCDTRHITSFALDVPRGWVTRHSPGLWICKRTIPYCKLIGQTFYLPAVHLERARYLDFDFGIFSAPGRVPTFDTVMLPRDPIPWG